MKGIQGTRGDRLLKLVHGLPVPLKKQFREYWNNRGNTSNSANKSKSFLSIFNWIDKQKKFDLAEFTQAFPAAKDKPAMYLGRAFKKVLKFMVWNTSDQEGLLREKLQQVKELIINGGDYVSALQINHQLLQTARLYEYPDIELAALVNRPLLLEELEMYEEIEKEFMSNIRDTQVAQMKALTLNYFESNYKLYHNLMREFFVARGYVDYQLLTPLLDHPQISQEKADTPKKKVYWYLLSYFIELYKGNIPQAIEKAETVLALFQNHPYLTNDFPFEYPKLLTRLSINYTNLNPGSKSKFSNDLLELSRQAQNSRLRSISFRGFFISEIAHYSNHTPQEAVRVIKQYQDELLSHEPNLKIEDRYVNYFFAAKAYILTNDWKNGISWLRKIIQNPHRKIRKDLQSIARILLMFGYAELEEFSLLNSTLRSYVRWYPTKNGKQIPKFEKRALKYLRKIPVSDNTEAVKFLADMDHLFEDEFEKRVLGYFDFQEFIKSKT